MIRKLIRLARTSTWNQRRVLRRIERTIDAVRRAELEIQAMRWNGSKGWADVIVEWIGENAEHMQNPNGYDDAIAIDTLEGTMHALPGDYIIRGVQGEFYPCKPDIFEATYGRVIPPDEGAS